MKRDPVRELADHREVEGLRRKVSKLGALAAKFQSERDKSHEASSRYLIDLTEALDLLRDLFDNSAWDDDHGQSYWPEDPQSYNRIEALLDKWAPDTNTGAEE